MRRHSRHPMEKQGDRRKFLLTTPRGLSERAWCRGSPRLRAQSSPRRRVRSRRSTRLQRTAIAGSLSCESRRVQGRSRPSSVSRGLTTRPLVRLQRDGASVPVSRRPALVLAALHTRPAGARVAPIARLADGVSIEVASSNVEAVLQQIRKIEPRVPGTTSTSAVSRFEVRSIQEYLVEPVRPLIVVIASAVAFVPLIACVNVTNLLLNRNAARRQELAMRVALGASPARVARYVLTETLLLATFGGAAGMLLALGTVSLLRTLGTSLARGDLTLASASLGSKRFRSMEPRSHSPSRLPSVSGCSSDFCRLFATRSRGIKTPSTAA